MKHIEAFFYELTIAGFGTFVGFFTGELWPVGLVLILLTIIGAGVYKSWNLDRKMKKAQKVRIEWEREHLNRG